MNRYKKPAINKDELNSNLFILEDNRISNVDLPDDVYSKIYQTPSNRKLIVSLSDVAIRLFVWLSFEIDEGKDWLWINHKRYMDETGVKSLNTYKKACRELLDKQVLILTSHSNKQVYYINPQILYKGKRVLKSKQVD